MENKEPKYANIVFPIPVDRCFSYILPEEFRGKAKVGMRALAPFGKGDRETEGVIVELLEKPQVQDVKEVMDVLDEEPFFADDMLKLTRWIADYYMSSWGEALRCATPAGINIISKRIVSMSQIEDRDAALARLSKTAPRQAQILTALSWEGDMSIQKLKARFEATGLYSALAALENKGLISITTEISRPRIKPKSALAVRLAKPVEDIKNEIEEIRKRAPKQADVLQILMSREEQLTLASHLAKLADTNTTTIRSLEKKGLVSFEEVEIFRDPLEGEIFDTTQHLKLNPDQENALGEIDRTIQEGRREPFYYTVSQPVGRPKSICRL